MFPEIPGYTVHRQLGRGGMGIVYQAVADDSNEPVAIKLILQGRGADYVSLARFRIEAEAMACLDHPHIIRVLKVGVVNACPFMVTEYAEHGTIGDFISRSPQSIDWCVNAVRQIALGVHHAHARTMIHRDIKPSNILIMADGTPKITDFGLVKFRSSIQQLAAASRAPHINGSFFEFDQLLNLLAVEGAPDGDTQVVSVDVMMKEFFERTGVQFEPSGIDQIKDFLESTQLQVTQKGRDESEAEFPQLEYLTHPGELMGSPQFMAPEQVDRHSESIGPATDVYALGATLYWLLTGEPIVSGKSLYEILKKIPTEFPTPLRDLNERIPIAVESVVWKAIQKRTPPRYANCKLFADELECCLTGVKPAAQLSREKKMEKIEAEHSAKNEKYKNLFLNAFPAKKDSTSQSQNGPDSMPKAG